MERAYRRMARKVYRLLRHPRRRKASRFHGWLARQVFDRRLWVPERHAFVNGLAIGSFFSMLPFFLPQTIFAVLVCSYRRWNIPIAFACCWVSNMATLVPLVYSQVNLGVWAYGLVTEHDPVPLRIADLEAACHTDVPGGFFAGMTTRASQMVHLLGPNLGPWLVGSVLSALILTALAYGLGHAFWSIFVHRVPVAHEVPHRHVDGPR